MIWIMPAKNETDAAGASVYRETIDMSQHRAAAGLVD